MTDKPLTTGRAEGMPIKQSAGSQTKDEGGVCDTCKEHVDVSIYDTDTGRKRFCSVCDKQDDDRRYGRV